ncbi:nucleoporin p58/p45 [Elysia marginata]|uniref:Nucleoporin p58/p45 n=1 Tax=Elysia marginata TaxID=1093978 RepID=A0AAV4INZ7_9GAST|nr:nucleoporin p58/p45 [Elysia marginata]
MQPFSFGGSATTTTAASSPFAFNLQKTAAPTLNLSSTTNTGAGGFNFGLNKTTASTGLLATPATTSTAGFGGFGATQPASTASSGFSFGQTGAAVSTTSSGLGGFNFGKSTTTTSAPSLGGFGTGTSLLGTTSGTAGSTGLGGTSLFGNTSTSSAGSSIFASLPASSTASTGLGGLDPNTALKHGSGGTSTSASDGKTLKESILPPELTATVDSLQKYVKEEKSVREDIARMSSKPMLKVQEDVTALRQLLSVVATGLQRNACSVEKLKLEMTQKLKNAEMAQRTKDIPAGLQYENTAPTEYFQHLVEEFEERMVTYRQQIDTLDNHLAALHQPSPHSPAEVLALMKKLHETFISLAAQLQQVHEAVKAQKDQFLTYRRVFHGDTKNVFQKAGPPPKVPKKTQLSDLAGPNPFPGMSNAAQAMAMVHIRAQQPQGPPVIGLTGGTQSGFSSGGFGGGLFGGIKPATGGVGSLFSSTSLLSGPASTTGFGTVPTLGSSTTAALNLAGTNLGGTPQAIKQPFQLQKPPQGAKRGKR